MQTRPFRPSSTPIHRLVSALLLASCGDDGSNVALDASSTIADAGEPCSPGPVRCLGDTAVSCVGGVSKRVDCIAIGDICTPGFGCGAPDLDAASARDGAVSTEAGALLDSSSVAPPAVGPGNCKVLSLEALSGEKPSVRIQDALDDVMYGDSFSLWLGEAGNLAAPGMYQLTDPSAPVRAYITQAVTYYDSLAPFEYRVESGTVVLDQVLDATRSRGSVKDVRLRRCERIFQQSDPTGEGGLPKIVGCEPAPTTGCVYVASYAWDHAAPVTSCGSDSDCGSGGAQFCDPASRTCKTAECNASKSCAAGLVCSASGGSGGRCTRACVPRAGTDTCGAGEECISTVSQPSRGLCMPRGTVATGEHCEFRESTINTGCSAADTFCARNGACSQSCNLFGEGTAPACPAGSRCMPTEGAAFCSNETPTVTSPIGGSCPVFMELCAPDASRYRGVCGYSAAVPGLSCLQICLHSAPSCGVGSCQNWDGYYGYCAP